MPHDSSDTIILGSSFMRGYYVEFDKTAQSIGIAPNTQNSKIQLHSSTVPTRLRGFSAAKVAGLGSGMAVTLGLWLWLVIAVACYTMNRATRATQKTVSVRDGEAQLIIMNDATEKKDDQATATAPTQISIRYL